MEWGFNLPLELTDEESALAELGVLLLRSGYAFTTVSPDTHQKVLARPQASSSSLRDVFGWSRAFARDAIDAQMIARLEKAGALRAIGGTWISSVRYSTLGDQLFVHSAFPTVEENAVFFGPDTYRFANVIGRAIARLEPTAIRTVIDVGCGSGAGGLHLARLLAGASPRIILSDINARAVSMARVNCAINGTDNVEVRCADLFDGLPAADVIVANPPYLVDAGKRTYRHGGGAFGFDLSRRIIADGVKRLNPGGSLILYTGSAIVEGADLFQEAIAPLLRGPGITATYEVIDPDVFGGELEHPHYNCADRIAVVSVEVMKARED